MRIAIFSETYLPDTNGVATHIKTLKDGLEELGHDVLVVRADSSSRISRIEKDIMYCPAIKAKKKLYNYSIASPLSIHRLFMIKKWNPDIIHIQNEFGIGISGIWISKMLKKPLVYTLHTMYDDYIWYISPKPFIKITTKLSHKYFKSIAKKAQAVTGASQKIEDYFKNCGVKKKISIIPNSVELDLFHNCTKEEKDAAKSRLGVSEKTGLFCFCGRLGTEKNVELLLKNWKECVERNSSLMLLIIGDGPSKEDFVNYSKKLKIEKNVLFIGKIPHADIPPYYAACDGYITASLSENYSISMLEAMASGLPVIHAYDEKNECQVAEGLNGYSFRNADEMYNAVNTIVSKTDDEKTEMHRLVSDSVEQSGAKDLAKYLLEIYSQVIKNNENSKKSLKSS